ncbi:MAG TPA: hypothetical protein VFF06_17120 [Polyangia bacterium]|nr:hypothetical protein [Polyangia bacterium]
MGTRRWLLIGFAAALIGGCAHHESVIDERVARLPAPARQRIVGQQQQVDVAEWNVRAARAARDEARQYLRIAEDELRAARTRLDAARASLELARGARDPATLDAADRELRAAEQQVIAKRLGRDYADRLFSLRKAELDERAAQVDVARADLDWMKMAELNRHGVAGDLSAQTYGESRAQARAELARRRQRVAALRGETADLRAAWEQQQRAAAARASIEPLPPPPPKPLPPPSSPQPAPTDVNEGPAAPQSMPNPNFAR